MVASLKWKFNNEKRACLEEHGGENECRSLKGGRDELGMPSWWQDRKRRIAHCSAHCIVADDTLTGQKDRP